MQSLDIIPRVILSGVLSALFAVSYRDFLCNPEVCKKAKDKKRYVSNLRSAGFTLILEKLMEQIIL